ncbi:MAG: hypothetical protein FJ290_02090, partial [Planctomycetes bacterium]|nr:hypothetical protein [Planctomycetota bacterium]
MRIGIARALSAGLLCAAALAASPEKPFPELLQAECRAQHEQLAKDLKRLDWFKRVAPQAFNAEALVTEKDRDPTDIVLRRTRALLADLQRYTPADGLKPLAAELDVLVARAAPVAVGYAEARLALYHEACALRRKIAFANPLLDFTAILFAKHHRSRVDHMCDQYFGWTAAPGGGIFALEDAFGAEPRVRDLLADAVVESGRLKGRRLAGGSFLQPALSFDARTIIFSYTECGLSAPKSDRWSPERSYHVFSVGADGSHLRQLTDGGWNDLHPSWLADDRIVFISERRGAFGRCHPRQVPLYTLHAMDADGD